MKHFKNSVYTCLAIFVVIALGVLLAGGRDKYAMVGLTGFLLSLLYFLVGFIACIPKSSRGVGKGMLLSAGILLLIGISVCSVHTVNMH